MQFRIGRMLQHVSGPEYAELRAFDPAVCQFTVINLTDNPSRLAETEIDAGL